MQIEDVLKLIQLRYEESIKRRNLYDELKNSSKEARYAYNIECHVSTNLYNLKNEILEQLESENGIS